MDLYQQQLQLQLEEKMSILGLRRLQANNQREREAGRGYAGTDAKIAVGLIGRAGQGHG